MLVSDLDDTMIGDDASTAEFTRWWREEGVAAGGRLVFNTGRVSATHGGAGRAGWTSLALGCVPCSRARQLHM